MLGRPLNENKICNRYIPIRYHRRSREEQITSNVPSTAVNSPSPRPCPTVGVVAPGVQDRFGRDRSAPRTAAYTSVTSSSESSIAWISKDLISVYPKTILGGPVGELL